jgi:uncharacterized membrane protein SirB2
MCHVTFIFGGQGKVNKLAACCVLVSHTHIIIVSRMILWVGQNLNVIVVYFNIRFQHLSGRAEAKSTIFSMKHACVYVYVYMYVLVYVNMCVVHVLALSKKNE